MSSPAVSLPPIPPIIAQLTGPLLLGHFFNWGLFGVLTVQTYVYYLAFPNDRRIPKTLALGMYIFELLQTVLATRDAFRNFGTGWGNMIMLSEVGWLWFSVPVMGATISCVTQLFFAWRIWILSQKLVIPSAIALLSVVQAVAGIWSGIYAHFIGNFAFVQEHTLKTTIVWLGGTALCDVIIAVSMTYYLSHSRTGFRSTNALLAKFVRITVETGAVCATFAILDLAFFIAFKNNNYHLAPSIALSKLYSNSLLVVLNARVRILGGRNSGDTTVADSTLSYSDTNTLGSGSRKSYANQLPKSTGTDMGRMGISVAVARETTADSYNYPMVNTKHYNGSPSDQGSEVDSKYLTP